MVWLFSVDVPIRQASSDPAADIGFAGIL